MMKLFKKYNNGKYDKKCAGVIHVSQVRIILCKKSKNIRSFSDSLVMYKKFFLSIILNYSAKKINRKYLQLDCVFIYSN